MKAVLLTAFGPPDVLVAADVPDPVPGEGQVVVQVSFANITFVETQLRAGRSPGPWSGRTPPFVPGNGVGGVVASTGSGVDEGLLGRRVVTSTGGTGGYAEAVAVAASGLIEVPPDVDMADAVALLADGRTAMALVTAAEPLAGRRVLVEAAAGGVGSLLVQLAKQAGATVIAAAGGDRKLALAHELGADVTVDYLLPDWTDRVGGIDVVFDGVGGDIGRAAFELLGAGGRLFAFGLSSGTFTRITDDETAERGVTVTRGLSLPPDQLRELTAAVLAEAAAGGLKPVIGQRFPLPKAADAHAAMESRGTLGKTLLVVS